MLTPLLDTIPLRRSVDGNSVTFYSSAGLAPEVELEDEIKVLARELADEIHDEELG